VITTIFAGLSTGAIYALIAIGYNITLTSSGVLNFAFANTLVLGGFLAITWTDIGLPVVVALAACALVCATVAVVEERVAIRFLPVGSHAELITTLGAATILTGLTARLWGSEPQRLVLFDQHPLELLGGRVLPNSLILIGLAALFGIGLHVLMNRTRFGLISRAHAFDREATMLRGVNVRSLSIAAFAISGVFAGLVGPFVAVTTVATPYIALTLALKGFIVLALGGLGSQLGAVVAGLLLGVIEALTALWIGPFYGTFAVFVVFVLVLLFRSGGLFGSQTARLV
jgi:branched-chain amino acid transport system permease protein